MKDKTIDTIAVIGLFIFVIIFIAVHLTLWNIGEEFCKEKGLGTYSDIFLLESPRCVKIESGEKHTYLINHEELRDFNNKTMRQPR